jgi:hypothetical protein
MRLLPPKSYMPNTLGNRGAIEPTNFFIRSISPRRNIPEGEENAEKFRNLLGLSRIEK